MKHKKRTKRIASVVMKICKEQNVVKDVQESISLITLLLKKNAQLRGFLQSKIRCLAAGLLLNVLEYNYSASVCIRHYDGQVGRQIVASAVLPSRYQDCGQ